MVPLLLPTQMMQNNPTIAAVLLADLVAFCGLNLSGMVVIQELGAVYKTVLETARTLFVWLVGLGLYYSALGGGLVGESWHDYSGVQLAGFAVLVMGTMLYGQGNAQRVATQEQQVLGCLLLVVGFVLMLTESVPCCSLGANNARSLCWICTQHTHTHKAYLCRHVYVHIDCCTGGGAAGWSPRRGAPRRHDPYRR